MGTIVIANWKMNFTLPEAIDLAEQINHLSNDRKNSLLIAPPAPYLALLQEKNPDLSFCSQDVSVFTNFGPYTGEFSSEMLAKLGIKYSIVGHSERRSFLRESNTITKKKVQNCLAANITPIVCIGEHIDARQNGNFKEFIADQLEESIPSDAQNIIIAYEPIWAVGAGITPTYDEISEVIKLIDKKLSVVAKKIRLVYGGSVNSSNYKEILNIDLLSGVMIGNASLSIKELNKILSY